LHSCWCIFLFYMNMFEFLKLPEFFRNFLKLLSIFYELILFSALQKYYFSFSFPFSSFSSLPGLPALSPRQPTFFYRAGPLSFPRQPTCFLSFTPAQVGLFFFLSPSFPFLSPTGGARPSSSSYDRAGLGRESDPAVLLWARTPRRPC